MKASALVPKLSTSSQPSDGVSGMCMGGHWQNNYCTIDVVAQHFKQTLPFLAVCDYTPISQWLASIYHQPPQDQQGAIGVHDAVVIAACIRAYNSNSFQAQYSCPYTSCNDCCIVHSNSTAHPALTCADAGPDLCSLHPDLYTLCLRWLSLAATYDGTVSPSAFGTNTPLALAVFPFLPLVQIAHLHSSNFHCCVVI